MKVRYTPLPLPYDIDQRLGYWLMRELQRIAESLAQDNLLDEVNVEPTAPVTGQIVLADGTNWNPGSGAGVYVYYGSAWNKLG